MFSLVGLAQSDLVVVVSPHIDDAIYSTGGVIARLHGEGVPLLILNVFSQTLFTAQGLNERAYEWRKDEERRALQVLDSEAVEVRDLGFPDVTVRGGSGGSEGLASLEWSIQECVTKAIDRKKAIDPVLFVPSAIGRHVDHVITRRAIEDVRRARAFYLDIPYVLWTQQSLPRAIPFPIDVEQHIAAVECFRSQVEPERSCSRELRRRLRQWGGVLLCETPC